LNTREKYEPDVMIEALQRTGGVIAAAARLIGCSRNTVMRYIEQYDEVREVYDQENEVNLDDAESTLIDYVRGTATWDLEGRPLQKPIDEKTRLDALKFYLRTKGRQRGYGDRQDIDVTSGGKPLVAAWPEKAREDPA
jgi:transposase-like protein